MNGKKVKLVKKGFKSTAYKNTIDTNFTQLVTPPPPIEETITVDEFFELYNTLFYEIPPNGDNNSHEFLIKRSSDYIGYTEETEQDIQVLLDEITSLREQLLNTEKELREVQISKTLELIDRGEGVSTLTPGAGLTSQPTNVGGNA